MRSRSGSGETLANRIMAQSEFFSRRKFLGAATNPFWSDTLAPWTQAKVWSCQNLSADHALPIAA